nr:tRNA-splicing endonuclease subunit Sen15-like [Cryptomonas curvata]
MFLSEELFSYYIDIAKVIKLFSILRSLNAMAAFQVYIDLCLFRGWKKIRLFYDLSLNFYIVIAINPNRKKKTLEFFFPIFSDVKIVPDVYDKVSKFLHTNALVNFSKKINLAFVDQDSTIAYYCLVFNVHKTIGPFV